jgi:hypothetical protein
MVCCAGVLARQQKARPMITSADSRQQTARPARRRSMRAQRSTSHCCVVCGPPALGDSVERGAAGRRLRDGTVHSGCAERAPARPAAQLFRADLLASAACDLNGAAASERNRAAGGGVRLLFRLRQRCTLAPASGLARDCVTRLHATGVCGAGVHRRDHASCCCRQLSRLDPDRAVQTRERERRAERVVAALCKATCGAGGAHKTPLLFFEERASPRALQQTAELQHAGRAPADGS